MMNLFDDIERIIDKSAIDSFSVLYKFVFLNEYDVLEESKEIRQEIEFQSALLATLGCAPRFLWAWELTREKESARPG